MQQAVRYGQRRVMRRVTRTLPWIGTALAILAIGSTIRRKGFVRGSMDTALNAVPVVGGIKNLAETICGKDFFRDREPRPRVAR
jgi:hypothetical protein